MDKLLLITYIILWIVVILQSILLLTFMKHTNIFITKMTQFGRINGDQGLIRGSMVPHFRVKDQFKNIFKVEPNQEYPKTLIFISETCPTCKRIITNIDANHQLDVNNMLFIANGNIGEEYFNILSEHNLRYVVKPELFQKYSIHSAPAALLINQDGKLMDNFILNSIKDLNKIRALISA
ncbi:hypothetical protein ACSVDA_21820 [Cytobacillus sp. Hm23]